MSITELRFNHQMLETENSITIDDKKYSLDEFSDVSQGQIISIEFIDKTIKDMKMETEALKMLRHETVISLRKYIDTKK